MTKDPVGWLKIVRDGASVKRMHTVKTIGEHTVGEHSFGVALLVLIITEGGASSNLIKAALLHDLAEQHTGDLPAPVKWNNPVFHSELTEIERIFEERFGLHVNISEGDRVVLKWADLLDLTYYCLDQYEMGNCKVVGVLQKAMEALRGLPHNRIGEDLLDNAVIEFRVIGRKGNGE